MIKIEIPDDLRKEIADAKAALVPGKHLRDAAMVDTEGKSSRACFLHNGRAIGNFRPAALIS